MAISLSQIDATISTIEVEVSGLDDIAIGGNMLRFFWLIVVNDGNIPTVSNTTLVETEVVEYDGSSTRTYTYRQLNSTYADYCDSSGEYLFYVSIENNDYGKTYTDECYGTLADDSGDEEEDEEEYNYYFNIKNITSNSFEIKAYELPIGYDVEFWVYNEITKKPLDIAPIMVTNSTVTLEVTGLSPNTEYSVSIAAGKTGDWLPDKYITTLASPYSFIVVNNKDGTVGAIIWGVSSGDKVKVNINFSSTGYGWISKTWTATNSPFSIDTIGSVSVGTSYIMEVFVNNASIGTETFMISKIRPNNWSWAPTIASESIIQLSAEEWNNFTSRIDEFRVYKDLSEYSTFTTAVSSTTNPTNPTLIGKDIVNEAITAISGIDGHDITCLPSEVKEGDQITASVFNGLKDALNAIS